MAPLDPILQPLRIPRGWLVAWHEWPDLDPTPGNLGLGHYRNATLFLASHEGSRLYLDLEWRPEGDPGGEFVLSVTYTPWLRTEGGRRCKRVPADPTAARPVFEFRTRDRAEAVRQVEAALVGRREWQEPN